jgi:hypothetical protein
VSKDQETQRFGIDSDELAAENLQSCTGAGRSLRHLVIFGYKNSGKAVIWDGFEVTIFF